MAAQSGHSFLRPITLGNHRVQASEFQIVLRFCSRDKKDDILLPIADVEEFLDESLKEGVCFILPHQIIL